MKDKFRFFTFCVLAVSIFIFTSCKLVRKKSPSDLKEVLQNGRLTVISETGNMGYQVDGDSIFGFQYELVKAFADSLNVELRISEMTDIESAIRSLNWGEADIIARFLPITTQFNDELLFSAPIFSGRLMLVQNSHNDSTQKNIIHDQRLLADDTISLIVNSPYIFRINHLSDEIADTIYLNELENVSSDSLVSLVASGKIKYTVCPEFFVSHYKKMYPQLDFSLPLSLIQEYGWAVHVNSGRLKEELDEFLNYFIYSPEYRRIYARYFF